MQFRAVALAAALTIASSAAFPARADAAPTVDHAVAQSVASACATPGTPTQTVYLPNITRYLGGTSGWYTPFIVQNTGTATTTLNVSFYKFSDGSLVTCRTIPNLAPGTSFADVPTNDQDLPFDAQFSVVVQSFGSTIVSVVNEHAGSGDRAEAMSYDGVSSGATSVFLPNITRRFFGFDTPFIIQNLGTAQTTATAHFVSFDGSVPAVSAIRTIDPGRSQFIDPNSEPGLIDGHQYAVTVTASQPLSVVVNTQDDQASEQYPKAYSDNGLTAGGATLYGAYAAKNANGIGRSSPIVVQNMGAASASPTITFTLLGGGTAQTFGLGAIQAGSSRVFDPRYANGDTAQPFCAGAVAGCLADGEYAFTISAPGASLAAVVNVISPATAMGYAATSSPSPSRVYLPNVTRTLGGPAGWTTPILVQSAGATAATLHWYRFSDGALIQIQQLSGLVSGGAVRVDPRAVTGLSDNTQYAVVIDARGPITAIVTELSFLGGDGAMAYEGFPSTQTATPVPTTVAIAPATATVQRAATQQFTAAVSDQFGATLAGQSITWSVAPATLGTIDATGLFTAGQVGGAGFVTAGVQGSTGTAAVTVQVPATTTIGGISFLVTATASADLYTETSISAADVQRLATQIVADVTQVQTDYAQPYASRPAAYILASSATFAQAVQTIGGASSPPPPWASGECCFGPNRSWVFINWQAESGYGQITVMRHELTHAMERQLAPQVSLPAWFNEGNAHLEEFTVAGTLWYALLERDRAASMAALNSLFTLADLTSQPTWDARADPQATYEYAVAAQAVQLLRNDIGLAGELGMFRAMAQGQTFEAAYATVVGQPFSTFSSTYAARIRGLAPAYPGIATAGDASSGPGISFVIYGLPASAPFTLSISGDNGYRLTGSNSRTADAYGVYYSFLTTANGWPAGTYTISATWSGGTVSTSVAKTSSLSATFGIGLDSGAEVIHGSR